MCKSGEFGLSHIGFGRTNSRRLLFQVTSAINSESSNQKVVPCLGLAWANLVGTRIQIHRTNTVYDFAKRQILIPVSADEPNQNVLSVIREMEIVFSPELPQRKAPFIITAQGIEDVPLISN